MFEKRFEHKTWRGVGPVCSDGGFLCAPPWWAASTNHEQRGGRWFVGSFRFRCSESFCLALGWVRYPTLITGTQPTTTPLICVGGLGLDCYSTRPLASRRDEPDLHPPRD